MSIQRYLEGHDFRGLNIGCGNAPIEGFLNVDIGDCEKDMRVDINKPLPFKDASFGAIKASHVLEHIEKKNFFYIFGEIHRVLRPEGVFAFEVPQAGSDNYFTDPTHTMPFTNRTMDFLIDGKQLRENGLIYGATYSFIEIEPPKLDNNMTLYFRLSK